MDTQSRTIRLLRFMSLFLGSKLVDIKCTKNYFSLNGQFSTPKGKIKAFPNGKTSLILYLHIIFLVDW